MCGLADLQLQNENAALKKQVTALGKENSELKKRTGAMKRKISEVKEKAEMDHKHTQEILNEQGPKCMFDTSKRSHDRKLSCISKESDNMKEARSDKKLRYKDSHHMSTTFKASVSCEQVLDVLSQCEPPQTIDTATDNRQWPQVGAAGISFFFPDVCVCGGRGVL